MADGKRDGDGLPALLWDEMPEDASNHPDYMAMQALMDELSPIEQAENFKVGTKCRWILGYDGKDGCFVGARQSKTENGHKDEEQALHP